MTAAISGYNPRLTKKEKGESNGVYRTRVTNWIDLLDRGPGRG